MEPAAGRPLLSKTVPVTVTPGSSRIVSYTHPGRGSLFGNHHFAAASGVGIQMVPSSEFSST